MPLQEILTYWRILRKRLWLIALLTLTTVGTIFFQQHTATPTYKASLRFQITPPPLGEVRLYEGFRTPYVRDEIPFIRGNFLNVLTSGAVARQVIEELGLEDIDTRDITSNIETEEIEGSDFTRVIVSASEPQLAADIANALFKEALQQYGQLRARSGTMSRQFITAELETVWQELQQVEEELITFKIENRVGSLDEMISQQQILLRLLRLNRDEAWAKGSLDEAQDYNQLIAQREAELQDLVRLSTQHNTLQADVQQIRETYNFLLEKGTEAKLTENEALIVGFIQVLGEARPPSKPVSPYNFKILALGGVVSLALGVVIAFAWEFLVSKDWQAIQVNIVDAETGVYNKNYFLQRLGVEMARARRQQYLLSLALLNVDDMGALQGTRSLEARSEMLRKTAVFLKQYLREEDLLAYFEDATFALLLPDTSAEAAKEMTEELQARIAWTPFELERSGVKINLSSVAGVAIFDHNGVARDELIAKANQALQRAATHGHDRTYLATEE